MIQTKTGEQLKPDIESISGNTDLHLDPVIQARSLKLGHTVIQTMTGEQLKPDIESIISNI